MRLRDKSTNSHNNQLPHKTKVGKMLFMSVKIRLSKFGKKNAPAYRIVVSTTRTKRDGKFLDIIGHFNPLMDKKPTIDAQKLNEWIKKGAQLTKAVKKMVEGTYEFKKYQPQKETGKTNQDETQNQG